MKYLLDTNVVCETIKSSPNTCVINFLKRLDNDQIFISVLTIGEIRKGIEKLDACKRKDKLVFWLENDLEKWFWQRIVPIDQSVAEKWGVLSSGTKKPAIDTLIAATCLVHNLTLITRNIQDFQIPGLELINPFEDLASQRAG